jgi:lipopolysaccharide transport system ATP-binding protein
MAGELFPAMRPKIDRKMQGLCTEFYALRDISFEVKKGESVGIIGRNGSGKSTLLQIIAGTLQPTEGSVTVNGRVAALLELGSGFNPEFTGRENVYLNCSILGLTKDETEQRYDSIAEFADIGDFLEQPVKTYSSGMTMRLAFAVIAHVDADILIIDEALSVGDAFFLKKCMNFIRGFMQKGTLLFVSHDVGAVQSFCSTAIWLTNGFIKINGDTKTVTREYTREILIDKGCKTEFEENDKIKKSKIESLVKREPTTSCFRMFDTNNFSKEFGNKKVHLNKIKFQEVSSSLDINNLEGSMEVRLVINGLCVNKILNPIIGFVIKNELGQPLFGENTYGKHDSNKNIFENNERFECEFIFIAPILPSGDYFITVAVSNGTQEDHEICHWVEDAYHFRSNCSGISSGLIGIPMVSISLRKNENTNSIITL